MLSGTWRGRVFAWHRDGGRHSAKDDVIEGKSVMPKTRGRRSSRPETMQRNAIIPSFAPRVRFSVKDAKDPEPEIEGRAWLELRGQITEPIRDVQEIVFRNMAGS
jgi:hypothetical protein